MKFANSRYIPAILTVALLLGLTADTLSRPGPGDARPYHADVKAAVDAMESPEGWTFKDLKIPDAAVRLLKPNAQSCRQYFTPIKPFQFLLIQCKDARDMGGHFPPICYPSSGWVAVREEVDGKEKAVARPMTWTIGQREIIGMEYEFIGNCDGQPITRTVDNLLILPVIHDCYVRKIDDIRDAAADRRRQFYGAAQIQLIFDGPVSETD